MKDENVGKKEEVGKERRKKRGEMTVSKDVGAAVRDGQDGRRRSTINNTPSFYLFV